MIQSRPLQALVVDDQPYVRLDLRRLLQAHPEIEIAAEAGTLEEARAILTARRLDVVFLDIQLRRGTGFDLVTDIPPQTAIVFVTAFDKYAVRAFETNALDYLVKPVSVERLAVTAARLRARAASQDPSEPEPRIFEPEDVVLVKSDAARRFVPVRDVVAVTSIGGNYTDVHTRDGKCATVRRTFKTWQTVLPSSLFLRIHRTSIVNLTYATRIDRDANGSYKLHVTGLQEPVALSRRVVARLRLLLLTT